MRPANVDPKLVHIASALNRLNVLYAKTGRDAAELDALLCYLVESQSAGQLRCSTDIVREFRFGTLPTVTLRIEKLVNLGLVRSVVGSDRRVRRLEVTEEGMRLLAERHRLFNLEELEG